MQSFQQFETAEVDAKFWAPWNVRIKVHGATNFIEVAKVGLQNTFEWNDTNLEVLQLTQKVLDRMERIRNKEA